MSMQNESNTPVVRGLLGGLRAGRRGVVYAVGCLVFVAFLCLGITWGGSAVMAWFSPKSEITQATPHAIQYERSAKAEPSPIYVGQEWASKAAECEEQGLRIWVKYHKRTGQVISAYCAE